MMTPNRVSATEKLKLEPCRFCGKMLHRSTLFAHAHAKHALQLRNYLESRIGFGFSEVTHREPHKLPRAAIRS